MVMVTRGVMILLITSLFLAGCTNTKKQCDDIKCVDTALKNGCEEAIYKYGNSYNELSRSGNTCTLVSTLIASDGKKLAEMTCTWSIPVDPNDRSNCKTWNARTR